MKNIFIGILGAAAIAGSTIAMAGGPDNMSTAVSAPVAPAPSENFMSMLTGLYVGTDLGYAVSPNAYPTISGISNVDDGFAFAFHAGYNFNQYIGAEAGYLRLPKLGYKINGTFAGNDDNNVYSLMVKGSYPVMDKLNVFAKAGYSVITADAAGATTADNTGTFYNPVVAGGAEYRVLPNLGVNAQYMAIIQVDNQYPTTHLVTAGLNYYF